VVLAGLLCCPKLAAGEVHHAGVEKDGPVYHLDLDATIEADPDTVFGIVTDYEQLHELSRVVQESHLQRLNGTSRLTLLARSCILLFCFRVTAVSDLREDERTVYATIVPGAGDFKSGNTTWRFEQGENHSCRVRISGEMVPDFWIPPVIGPLILRLKVAREAGRIIGNIEQRAAHA